MTKKVWFQVGIGMIIALLIIKYIVEIHWIFNPLYIIIKTIFIPLLLGGVLYYISEPLQRLMEKKGAPRWASMLTIVLLLAGIVTGILLMIGNPISQQVNNLVKNAPTIEDNIMDAANFVFDNKENLPPQVEEFVDSVSSSIQNIMMTGSKYIVSIVSGTVTATFTLILVPFFFIYMLKDHEKFAPNIYNIFTGEKRTWVKETLADIDNVLRNYVQGQVLISLILATMMYLGYMIIELEYALLLALFAFFMNMIPFIGPWISLAPALVIAIIQDPILVVWVAVITLVAQQIESNLITPNIMGKSLDVHPLTVITIVLAAGNIGGFLFIIIAIPTYAVIKAIVINIYEERKKIKEAANKTV
ncbi:AI-2E family transporter [Ureibacillus chungkukjangi]|uniref:Putative PurR-regulated permease PerM n=1 Tax=Ureibacillus chungkukjangi TaxID=1202712 RepID=A0A318TPA2_9BACL|nr:AI-2E family transporter [Ureibacillus chungkukjangi]MCM3388708.1 AI-2E family transporter [Ureibacillus chungkukjangi]PYF06616.1 putative PurR-regulated permease PerM [Ureibacillus chungkukjangi]